VSAREPFWRNLTRFEAGKLDAWLAVRNALAFGLPLAAGVAIHQPAGGLVAGIGALNVAYSDGSDPYRKRARRMLVASFLVAAAVAVGATCGWNPWLEMVTEGTAAFAAGLLVAISVPAGNIGLITLTTLIVFAAHPLTPVTAALSAVTALGGGLVQTAFALATWPLSRYRPEQRALAAFYGELSRAAESARTYQPPAVEAPAASAASTEAQRTLEGLATRDSAQAYRFLALLAQAERARLALLALGRLRFRLERDSPQAAGLLRDALALASARLAEIAATLGQERASGSPHRESGGAGKELADLADELRHEADLTGSQGAADVAAILADARSQIQALDGQLRSARELAQHATPEGFEAYARIEAHTPWTLRLQSAMARLRANFTLRSTAFRHALRLAAAVALGDIAGHWLASWMGWQRAYWLPMTVAIVLRPDFTGTVARGVLRIAGTLAGLALATALFHLLAPSPPAQVVLLVLLAFCLRYFGPANYGLFAVALTALVAVLVSLTGVEPGPVIAARGWNTVAGGLIALAAYRLWPTWEYTQFGESLARLLDAYRAYVQLVRDAYLAPAESFASRLDPARLAARLARSELEASVARIRSEPGAGAERLRRIDMILANSHRFIQAAMALEAGLASSRPVPARPAFRVFANDVDFTLYYLAAALRGSPLEAAQLPDLRERHRSLLSATAPGAERHALVNVETDRVTNSLNTLSYEILSAPGPSRF